MSTATPAEPQAPINHRARSLPADPKSAPGAPSAMTRLALAPAAVERLPVHPTARGLNQASILQLQRVHGNRHVQKVLHRQPGSIVRRCGATPCACSNDERIRHAVARSPIARTPATSTIQREEVRRDWWGEEQETGSAESGGLSDWASGGEQGNLSDAGSGAGQEWFSGEGSEASSGGPTDGLFDPSSAGGGSGGGITEELLGPPAPGGSGGGVTEELFADPGSVPVGPAGPAPGQGKLGASGCSYQRGEREASRDSRGQVLGFSSAAPPAAREAFIFDFEPGRSAVREVHSAFLRQTIELFGLNTLKPKARLVIIEGFADCVDSEALNRSIRLQRALATKLFLIEAGAHAQNIDQAVDGQTGGQRGDNATQEGRALNRSARLLLVPTETDTPQPEDTPPDRRPCCPGSRRLQARILSGVVAGEAVVAATLTLEMHDLDCNRGQRFTYVGAGPGVGTPVSFSGTSGFESASSPSDDLRHFTDFVGPGSWISAQAQFGIGPSTDTVLMPGEILSFFGLLNFPDEDTEETGKGIGAMITAGIWARDGDEFAIGSGSLPHCR